MSVARVDDTLILEVAGGSWPGRRQSSIWYQAPNPSALDHATETFEALVGKAAACDFRITPKAELVAGGGFNGGRWCQAAGDGPEVRVAPEGVLDRVVAGRDVGMVVATTITTVHGWGDRLGVVVKGGRLYWPGGAMAALCGQAGELWYQPKTPEARDLLIHSVGVIGEICLISDGAGQALIIHDRDGTAEGRVLLLNVT